MPHVLLWRVLQAAKKRYQQIDGGERAAVFAYYAFFSLFPLTVLVVTLASWTVDPAQASQEVIKYLETYVPLSGEMQQRVIETISGVISGGGQAGVVSVVMLIWAARRGVSTFITTINRAWGNVMHSWWRLPIKSVALLGIVTATVLLGIIAPVLISGIQRWLFPVHEWQSWVTDLAASVMPWLVVFGSLTLFYKFAPRRRTQVREVWLPALIATLLLRLGEIPFVFYLREFASFNAIYGAFGVFIALMLWLYVCGSILIFGACLCAVQAETEKKAAQPG